MALTTGWCARVRKTLTGAVLIAILTAGLTALPGSSASAAPSAPAVTEARKAAATETAARAAAAESGKRVEVLGLRTERSETYADPDGTFTLREHAQPVRTMQGGTWADLDTTLVKLPNGRLAPKAASTAMTFSAGGDEVFATLAKDGKSLSYAWPGRLPKPVLRDDTATYRSVLPGVDLVLRADVDGFSHVLVVKSAEAAANPALASLDLPVKAHGLDVGTTKGGALVATDKAGGGAVFEAPQPVMWDSSGHADAAGLARAPAAGTRVADVGLSFSGHRMVLRPDPGLLRGKHTTYPVFIDPVIKTVDRTGWTWVSSYNSTLEGWKFSNTTDAGESGKGVGRCPADVSARCASSNDVQRQYYAMPTGSLEGKTILSAEFTITMTYAYNTDPHPVELHRVNSSGGSAINSGTNWTNQPSSKDNITSKSPTNPAGSCTDDNQNVRFGVTGTLAKAASSGWDTTTFRLQAGSEASYSGWKRFCNNATLEVNYNRAPYAPKMSELSMKPAGSCAYGEAEKHYADEAPTLSAIIWDPDHGDTGGNAEQLKAQFEIFWTGSDGVEKTYTVTTGYKTSHSDRRRDSGYAKFTYKVGTDIPGDGTGSFTIPQNTIVGWWVRGSDGTAWGDWSYAGDATRCEFIYDATKPAAPTVTSAEYPADDAWHRGVGDYGTFSFYSPGTDIASYRYQITGEAWKTVTPPEPGRPATLRWMPATEGPYTLIVQAVDQAGNSKETPNGYTILIDKGRAPTAAWALADPPGSSQAASDDGLTNATAGSGVTFGVKGPYGTARTAARLDGTSGAYLDAGMHVVDTDKTFTVSAWVMLPSLPTSSMSVVSQDGSAQSGFSLGYDGASKKWSFLTPDSEIGSMTSWQVLGPQPVPGEWTHLVGVYDMDDGPAPGSMHMYINGHLVGGNPTERVTTWNATGRLQIGRALEPSGYTADLEGTVADVAVFDRVVTADETTRLGGLPPLQKGYWNLDEAVAGAAPDIGGGTGLSLYGGASIYQADDSCDPVDPECLPAAEPLWGDGHLALNGTSAYADRPAGLLKPKASFTVTARARLSTPDATTTQAVFSLPGTAGTAAVVEYDPTAKRWQLNVTDRDATAATVTSAVATGVQPSAEGPGDHVALVYDALFGEARLYVNGRLAATPVTWRNTWDLATAKVQVGRTGAAPAAGGYFSGAVDEVRVFEGALDQPLVAQVLSLQSGESLGGEVT